MPKKHHSQRQGIKSLLDSGQEKRTLSTFAVVLAVSSKQKQPTTCIRAWTERNLIFSTGKEDC